MGKTRGEEKQVTKNICRCGGDVKVYGESHHGRKPLIKAVCMKCGRIARRPRNLKSPFKSNPTL